MLLARSALVVLLLALPLAAARAQAPGGTLTIVVNHFGKEVLDRGHTGTQYLQYNGHPYEALIGTARNRQGAGGQIQGYWDLAKIDAEFKRLRQIADLKVLAEELRKLNRETYAEYPFYPIAARHTTFAAGPRVADWSPGDYGVAWHLETVKARR